MLIDVTILKPEARNILLVHLENMQNIGLIRMEERMLNDGIICNKIKSWIISHPGGTVERLEDMRSEIAPHMDLQKFTTLVEEVRTSFHCVSLLNDYDSHGGVHILIKLG